MVVKKTDESAELKAGLDANNYNKIPAVVFIYILKVAGDEKSLCCVELNDNMLDLLQYSQLEVDAMGNDYFKTIMHPEDLHLVIDVIRFLKQHGRIHDYGTKFRVISKDGTISWIYMKCHVKSRHTDYSPCEFINCGIVMDADMHDAKQSIIYHIEFNRYLNRVKIATLKLRDYEFMQLYSNGYNFTEIAVKLHLGIDAIHSRKKRLLEKLDLASLKALMKFIIENGFIYLLFANLYNAPLLYLFSLS